MNPLSFKRHRLRPNIIRHWVWLYARFTLSLRDIEDLLAERGLDVSHKTVRRWFLKYGPIVAANFRRSRPRPSNHWHLAEMPIIIVGKRYWLWHAVDSEGEALGFPAQQTRNTKAALALMRKLMRRQGFAPSRIITDKLQSYGSAFGRLGLRTRHDQGLRANNRAENSHQPVRR